ncbi:hypothetical protein [Desulfovibrio psychrotolerans]|uniref:AlpA family phage regulatory protein n=1 Tax=Desulfovibrio psychrotolerans TaxID=415242 RepID=A0A7J0BRD3_9BACT|nr:hypothetical protein [Desulfovibrio psychrotolerans]GFM36249.1 hypothetical protein DSM19430T_09330 [Desulfovibrio psychrotolerans]
MTAKDNFIGAIRELLPPIFARHSLTEITGGLINSRTIANLQAKRQGPPSILFKGRVGFERGSFLSWLDGRIEDDPRNQLDN